MKPDGMMQQDTEPEYCNGKGVRHAYKDQIGSSGQGDP